MTSAENLYTKIQKLINSSRFNETFLLLKRELKKYPSLGKELEKLIETESTYKHMLAFLAVGHEDPSRKDMTEQIRETLFNANDMLLREANLTDSSDIYSSARRFFNLRNENISSKIDNLRKVIIEDSSKESNFENVTLISANQAHALDELFNYIWTMKGSPQQEFDDLASVLDSADIPDYAKTLMISAIVLGNISYFDPLSFELLIQTYETSQSVNVKARTLTGILLISMLHPHRLEGNINLKSRLMLSLEDEEFKSNLNDVLINIVHTYDTKRIDDKMRNEVIPGLMKLKPEIIDKMRNMASNAENFLSDVNPEWEEMIENSDISKKLQEINDMQLEGADVMVTAFSSLKNFPFFNSVSHWFLPFIPGYYEYSDLPVGNDEETIGRLTTVMCDSDLHSFLLSLNQMPEANRKQMFANLEAQMKETQEALSGPIGETDKQKLKKKIRHSLQDIYRFFKFFRKNTEFKDPFRVPFTATSIEKVMPLLNIDPDNIRVVAEFYFKNKYYDEAASMFELYNHFNPGDVNIWEKTGFSHDRMMRYQDAVDWYRKAELLNPDNQWLEKKLALSLKNSGNKLEALKYYRRVLEREPENYHLLMSLAQCLIDTGNSEEALKHLFHAKYLKSDKLDVDRAIAWTYLMQGNFEKANETYVKVRVHPDADATDFLNAAHSFLAGGNFKEALKNYRTFIDKTPSRDITQLVIAFRDDTEIMKKLGIKTSDLRLIVDKIRYDLL